MKNYNIVLLPGDGVGPEVTEEAVRVLMAAQEAVDGFKLDMQTLLVGCGQYEKTGAAITEEDYQICQEADAIFMGAMGQNSPDHMTLDKNGTEVSGHVMFKLRFGLDLFAGVRPIKLYPGVPSALSGQDNIDFVVLRESCEGLFASYGGGIYCRDYVATDTQVITRMGTEKVSKVAFDLAMSRNGRVRDGKKLVTLADKGNVFRSMAFMRKVFAEVAKGYDGRVEKQNLMIDALALLLVQHPEDFDIILFENMHGDIMSDMAAAFVGGMGMAPSGDIGLEHAMFQPAHGTAPAIAGQGIVNPTAAILSGKMMLEWLGGKHENREMKQAAEMIEKAVYETFLKGIRTTDVKGTAGTKEFTDEVIRQIYKQAS